MADGRFAPSPTGSLHLGNLRTAVAAWLFARSAGSRFLVRMEDLDRVTSSRAHADQQLADLARLGLDWDGEVVFQSERFDRYHTAIDRLTEAGLTYRCFCTRREIAAAATAPHGDAPEGAYPGTCRTLTVRAATANLDEGRKACLRFRGDSRVVSFIDAIHGFTEALVDDLVLRRNDGVPAYNLAVVVDDAEQGVGQVVRGDDLLLSTPRQIELGRVLGLAMMSYAHVPLVLGPTGTRLAKRHGAITLSDRLALGEDASGVLGRLAHSLGLVETAGPTTAIDLLDTVRGTSTADLAGRFARTPWMVNLSSDVPEVPDR